MTAFEVSFEFTMEQFITVEATSQKEAIEKVQRGEYSVDDCESYRASTPNRKFRATRLASEA
jgi:hypothetical protein